MQNSGEWIWSFVVVVFDSNRLNIFFIKIFVDKATWIQFFKDASIPNEFIASYANKFIENRIRFDMLSDLDRPLLNEMGINAIGDCLSILKHSKLIMQKIEEAKKEANEPKKSGDVAQRIIQSYLNEPDPPAAPASGRARARR